MAQGNGKRAAAAQADIVARGGEKVADLTAATGAAAGAKYGAIGGAIGGTLGLIGGEMTTDRRAAEARAFEERKIGAGMAHEQGMQREKILGESALQGQAAQSRQQELQMQLKARKEEQQQELEFRAASEGKTTYDKTTGHFAPSPQAMQQRQAELSLTRAKGIDIFSEVSMRSERFEREMANAREKIGLEREEGERQAVAGMVKSIETLAGYEKDALIAMSKAGGGAGPLSGPTAGKSSEELAKFAEGMRTARNAQAFRIAAKTGDVSHIVPGSREQQIMTNRWIPLMQQVLQNSPMMGEMAARKGALWAADQVNKTAAAMTMAELKDPEIAAAIARAMMGGNEPGQSPGSRPGSQPGGGAARGGQPSPGQRPGGISIPRR